MTDVIHPAILKSQQWLKEIIVGLNFCPFAKKEMVNETIHYHVCEQTQLKPALESLALQCAYLVEHPEVETTLIIYNTGFASFEKYLDLLDYANELLIDLGFEGIFQLASFHPDYYFDGEPFNDPSNYTNRSPLPTLHLIREASMERVLSVYKDPEKIPENNITLTRKMGSHFFEQVLKTIHNIE